MKVLRTPDKYFKDIKGYPFKPIYTNINSDDGTELRIHHIDEGPRNGPILLAMHGQPVWSYLYSRMIPILNQSGIRVIAPDLIGYGKSDKPASRQDYSYQNQVDWMNQWLVKNNLDDFTSINASLDIKLYASIKLFLSDLSSIELSSISINSILSVAFDSVSNISTSSLIFS